jgi:hypothetical protein
MRAARPPLHLTPRRSASLRRRMRAIGWCSGAYGRARVVAGGRRYDDDRSPASSYTVVQSSSCHDDSCLRRPWRRDAAVPLARHTELERGGGGARVLSFWYQTPIPSRTGQRTADPQLGQAREPRQSSAPCVSPRAIAIEAIVPCVPCCFVRWARCFSCRAPRSPAPTSLPSSCSARRRTEGASCTAAIRAPVDGAGAARIPGPRVTAAGKCRLTDGTSLGIWPALTSYRPAGGRTTAAS